MRLGAIGTLVWDRIWHPAGSGPVEQWGGAVYSLSALSAACPDGWVVEPVMKVGADLASTALERLRLLPNLDLDTGVRVVPEPNNRVELRYHDPAHRTERLSGGVPPWSWEELEPIVAPLDALYINFLSGLELDLPTAERLRRGFPGPIYADLHSLFLSPPGDGPRVPRQLPNRERWLRCFDAVQLNESELALLTGDPDGHPESLLSWGPSLALVTLGGRGARSAARVPLPARPLEWRAAAGGGGVEQVDVPCPGGPVEGDPTGCGDVWGSVAWSRLLEGFPLRTALEQANRAATAKILNPDLTGLHDALRSALTS